jgi:sec-independent protein translocase protein TatA
MDRIQNGSGLAIYKNSGTKKAIVTLDKIRFFGMGLSFSHLIVVLIIALLLFGRGRVSELMADMAKGIKSFKKGLSDDEEDTQKKTSDAAELKRITDERPADPQETRERTGADQEKK